MTPLWLCLARIGESSPHAVEGSFSAGQRGKWEAVAKHVEKRELCASNITSCFDEMHGRHGWKVPRETISELVTVDMNMQQYLASPLSASGTSEMPYLSSEQLNRADREMIAAGAQAHRGTDDGGCEPPVPRVYTVDLSKIPHVAMRHGEVLRVNHAESVADTIDITDDVLETSAPALSAEDEEWMNAPMGPNRSPARAAMPPWPSEMVAARKHCAGGQVRDIEVRLVFCSTDEAQRFMRAWNHAEQYGDHALAEIERLREANTWKSEVLSMIFDDMVALDQKGYDGKNTPPMFYNDWLRAIVRRDRQQIERLKAEATILRLRCAACAYCDWTGPITDSREDRARHADKHAAECERSPRQELKRQIAALEAENARLRGELDAAEQHVKILRAPGAQRETDDKIAAAKAKWDAVSDRAAKEVAESERLTGDDLAVTIGSQPSPAGSAGQAWSESERHDLLLAIMLAESEWQREFENHHRGRTDCVVDAVIAHLAKGRISPALSALDVERATEAAWKHHGDYPPWSGIGEDSKARARDRIRAALRAIGIATTEANDAQ
jgi:hypothetical protein